MSIHLLHEKATLERHAALYSARTDMLKYTSDASLRDTYIRLAIMELESFIITVGGLIRPVQLLQLGNCGGFDEYVDLYDTRGVGISQALFERHLTGEQKVMVEAYPKLGFDLDIEFVEGSNFGADVASFGLANETAIVYSILTGKEV